MPVEYGTFKGRRTIKFTSADGKTSIGFGGRKANAIAAHLPELVQFAKETATADAQPNHQDITDRLYENECERRTGA